MKQQKYPGVLTAAQAAAFLRVGRSTIYQLIAAGELESIPVHGHHRIPAKLGAEVSEKDFPKGLVRSGTYGTITHQTPAGSSSLANPDGFRVGRRAVSPGAGARGGVWFWKENARCPVPAQRR